MIIFVTYKDDDSSLLSILQFPMGSFIVKSNTIVGISYCITALMERRFIQPFKISEEFLQNICEKSSELQEAGKFDFSHFLICAHN